MVASEPDQPTLSDTQSMTGVPLIDIRNATIYRGRTRVFENLTLKIDQREPAAILGPNGSGKTTLLKVINRELYPMRQDDAWVRILGRETWNVWELRSHIGIVSHDLQTRYRSNTTGAHVVLSGFLSSVGIHGSLANRISADQRAKAAKIMEALGIQTLANTELRIMSTGQQRRCFLARALVHDPDTLILDEPTAGLDLAASFDYLARIRQLEESGKNIILVTHLLNEIPPEIDRIILLRDGKVVADGRKDKVLTEENLRHTYGTDLRLAKIDDYYLAYPAES
jgi:iron complex transport system ATP-binding protein